MAVRSKGKRSWKLLWRSNWDDPKTVSVNLCKEASLSSLPLSHSHSPLQRHSYPSYETNVRYCERVRSWTINWF
jgi:hypothetical protein